tara:strand:- start:580 stop:702 length:123 start_codon:yes stop_codon:yes gene_type:complete
MINIKKDILKGIGPILIIGNTKRSKATKRTKKEYFNLINN